jgi:predicted ATP-dependent endonuclease of OLD family
LHLRRLIITSFLSIKETTEVPIDKKVTIFLGSNDHGKSNILRAIQHLNEDDPISSDEQNWDATSEPKINYIFSLTDNEFAEWHKLTQKLERDAKEKEGKSEIPEGQETAQEAVQKAGMEAGATGAAGSQTQESEEPKGRQLRIPPLSDGNLLIISRSGGNEELVVGDTPFVDLPDEIADFIATRTPRVELFKGLVGNLQDSATAKQINTDEFEFMQGVFFRAEIDPRTSEKLFTQSDVTMRTLDDSNQSLNESLRKIWAQGTNLQFELRHKGDSIELLVNDPAVKQRKVRMSKRSDGVTQFFRMSMILYARQKKRPANSYIYLFDDPGVYLHVQGQKDLMQVFEQLAEESQIVYATHSLFMLNQNFPERHLLIFKDEKGTKVDEKPYHANWRRATDALGVYWTSNILFSSKILLVEGDSDPIYIYELFRQMNQLRKTDYDVNMLGIMSFENYQNLRFQLQTLSMDSKDTKIAILLDGDTQGAGLKEKVTPICERLNIPIYSLVKDKSIEDYCPFKTKFVESVQATLKIAFEAEGKAVPPDLADRVARAWEEHTKEPKDATTGRWFKDLSTGLLGDEASKVGLARIYAELCRQADLPTPDSTALKRAVSVCRQIGDALQLPPLRARQEIIRE